MPQRFFDHRAVATIDTDAIRHNFALLRRHAEESGRASRLIAVVKANAYGHGIAAVTAALSAEGCDFFAVATLEEALSVRLLAPEADILILGYTPPRKAPLLSEAHVTQTVFSADYAAALNEMSKAHPVRVHIKVDCGMHRLGFAPEAVREMAAVAALPHLHATGLYTHFPAADTNLAATRYAFSRFLCCRRQLATRGLSFFCHAAASAALLSLPETALDGVRPGLALYGIPPVDTALALRPAMCLWAPVVQLHALPADTPVGYGGAFVTKRPTVVGICPIGYGDGLTRRTEGYTATLIHEKSAFSAPVIGHICMDHTLLDLTDTPAAPGDRVVFWSDPRPLAAYVGTIPYEILTAVSPRVERKRKGEAP